MRVRSSKEVQMKSTDERPPRPETRASGDPALTVKATMPKQAFHRRVMTQPAQILVRRRSKSSGHGRSFSSVTFNEKKDSKFSSFRRELIRGSSITNRRSRSLPQSERSRKLHDRTPSSTDVLIPHKTKTATGKNFYVRVTLDSLSGITIQKGPKRKPNASESPVITGYASLLSSGHQLAVSMPFSVDHEHSNSKLLWAGAEGEQNRDKRQLHFSLQLQRERTNSRDDDSAADDCKFNPKVVKMVIGLKCEDTKLPLGIATLVVNGKTAYGEDVDLAMLPVDDTSEKKNKQRVPFFGSNKPDGISFSDDYYFSLSNNAILHAQVDTKPDDIGKTKRQVWGSVDQQHVESRSPVEERRAEPEGNITTPPVADSKREPDHVPEEFMIPTLASPRNRRLKGEKAAVPPIEFVEVTAGANSFTSDISSRRSIIDHPCELTSKLVSSCFGLCGNTGTLDEEVNELKFSEDKYIVSSGGISTVAQAPPHSSAMGLQTIQETTRMTSFDMAQKSYEDLRIAQETLRRYANKTGIDVEDILDQGGHSAQYTSLQV